MMKKKRIRDYGIRVGRLETGKGNRITDVPGVRVGHCTIKNEQNHTGVTVIVPGEDNSFIRKYTAAAYVHNGFGKSAGLIQVMELGTLETPIALTNTLNVGLVWDALAGHMIDRCEREQVPVFSINPVVGECNDSRFNHISHRAVGREHVEAALQEADVDFEEGDVGAGAGTLCYGLKSGIGSASRMVMVDGTPYTVGVIVQSNFGATRDFVLCGKPAGEVLERRMQEMGEREAVREDRGSIMTIVATDLPVSSRQLERIIRRAGVGIARTGAYTGHGSGEIMIGFTTANRIPALKSECPISVSIMPEALLDRAFLAVAEATEEAILNSMVCAENTRGLNGTMYYSLAEFLPDYMSPPMPCTTLHGMEQAHNAIEAASTSSQTTRNVDAAVTGHASAG